MFLVAILSALYNSALQLLLDCYLGFCYGDWQSKLVDVGMALGAGHTAVII